jgi:hypothetical protein
MMGISRPYMAIRSLKVLELKRILIVSTKMKNKNNNNNRHEEDEKIIKTLHYWEI